MTNVFVVDVAAQLERYTFLGWENVLAESGVVITGDTQAQPYAQAFDHNDVTEQEPQHSAGYPETHVATFSLPAYRKVNYIGVLSKNGASCGLSYVIELFDDAQADWVTVKTFNYAKDGVPEIHYFGDNWQPGYFNALQVRVSQIFSASTPRVTSLHIGFGQLFDRMPALGYLPGVMGEVTNSRVLKTYTNNALLARQTSYGKQTQATLLGLEMADVREWWPDYLSHILDGRGVYLQVLSETTNDRMYGRHPGGAVQYPVYTEYDSTDLSLHLNGFA